MEDPRARRVKREGELEPANEIQYADTPKTTREKIVTIPDRVVNMRIGNMTPILTEDQLSDKIHRRHYLKNDKT